MSTYLEAQDDQNFTWDDEIVSCPKSGVQPVREAGLDLTKHKVFKHGDKAYPRPTCRRPSSGADPTSARAAHGCLPVRPPESAGYSRTLALKVIVCTEERRHPEPDSKARRLALTEVRNEQRSGTRTSSSTSPASRTTGIQAEQNPAPHPWRCQARTSGADQKARALHRLVSGRRPQLAHIHERDDRVPQGGRVEDQVYVTAYFGCVATGGHIPAQSRAVQIRHKDIKPETSSSMTSACLC